MVPWWGAGSLWPTVLTQKEAGTVLNRKKDTPTGFILYGTSPVGPVPLRRRLHQCDNMLFHIGTKQSGGVRCNSVLS